MSPRRPQVSAAPEPPAGLRLTEGAWVLAGVLLAHGVALGALDPTSPPEGVRAEGAAPARVEVKAGAVGAVVVSRLRDPVGLARPVQPVGPVDPAEARAPSQSPPPAAAPLPQRADLAPGANQSPAAPVLAEAPASSPAAAAALQTALPALPTPQALPSVQAAALPAEGDVPPPVYDTQMPPPFRLLFALRRGALSGQAELVMERTAAGYALDLKGTALGLEVLGMSSRGALGPNGLMPERFVDRRRGKDRLAANFDHAAGRITYSGTPAAQALWPGGQDRLSWMVQLAAIVEAAPTRYPAGSRIALSVSGARADVDTWTFVVQGRQRLDLPAGAVTEALHLTREPRRPYDTQVEVWLNPAQHHLPARARLTVLPGGETLELALAAP
jgi:hypothetical protein